MKLYARILAGPDFERDKLDGASVGLVPSETDAIMNYLFNTYSAWMEDTLDEYVECVSELRDTELCERRRSAKRKRNSRG